MVVTSNAYFSELARVISVDKDKLMAAGLPPEGFLQKYRANISDMNLCSKIESLQRIIKMEHEMWMNTWSTQGVQVNTSQKIQNFARSLYCGAEEQEEVVIVYVDCSFIVIQVERVCIGSCSCCTVPVNIIMRHAILSGAHGMFFIHNHPSNTLSFSDEDKRCISSLGAACRTLGLELHDGIIIGTSGCCSYKEVG